MTKAPPGKWQSANIPLRISKSGRRFRGSLEENNDSQSKTSKICMEYLNGEMAFNQLTQSCYELP